MRKHKRKRVSLTRLRKWLPQRVCQQEKRDQDKILSMALVAATIILIPSGYGEDVQYQPAVALLRFIDEACKQTFTGLISALADQETLVTLEQSIRNQKMK